MILIKNAIIVTVNKNKDILYDHSLVIKDDLIHDIGSNDELINKYEKNISKVINAQGKIVFPGLINNHTHLFQNLLKGMGDDLKLADWFADMTAPSSVHLTREDVYIGAMAGCIEGINSGTTTILDYMYPHPRSKLSDSVIKAFRDTKVRGILGRGMMNTGEEFGTPKCIMQDINEIKKDTLRLLEKYHGADNERIKIWLAPAAAWSNTKKSLISAWKLAQKFDTGFTIHVSETPFDRKATFKLHGCSDAQLLDDLRIVGPNVLMVHCVHLTERDIRMAQYYDMKVSHNPLSNMYLASGVAPIPRLIESGVKVGIATDGAASNNTQDMIEVLKTTALLQKVHAEDPTIITAEKALEMATIEAAASIGMEDEIGSLEEGKKADLFIYNPYQSAKSIPMHNPVSTLVYSGTSENVETVLIDGNIIQEKNMLKTINRNEILRNTQKVSDDLIKRSGIESKKKRKWRSISF